MVYRLRASDVAVLGAHAAFAGSTPTDVKTFLLLLKIFTVVATFKCLQRIFSIR